MENRIKVLEETVDNLAKTVIELYRIEKMNSDLVDSLKMSVDLIIKNLIR